MVRRPEPRYVREPALRNIVMGLGMIFFPPPVQGIFFHPRFRDDISKF